MPACILRRTVTGLFLRFKMNMTGPSHSPVFLCKVMWRIIDPALTSHSLINLAQFITNNQSPSLAVRNPLPFVCPPPFSSIMVEESHHVVLVPFLAQGHMIPTLDLARLLAEKGVRVTLVSTPANLSRIQPFVRRVGESGLPIQFLSLKFPAKEVGLLAGCENLDLLPLGNDSFQKLFRATCLMREPLKLHLQGISPPPTGIISDFCNPWTHHVARELDIPLFVFYSIPCFSMFCDHRIKINRPYDGIESDDAPVFLPDMPDRIEVSRAQARGLFPDPEWTWVGDEATEAVKSADGILVNTFESLEPVYVELISKAMRKNVWPVGPVSLCNNRVSDLASRGDKPSIGEEQCRAWLDSKEPQSVLYVSFGTVVRYSSSQVIELGLGLEAAMIPVVWVIKSREEQSDLEDWLADGFEERTRGRIQIVRGWAPQVLILSHPAIGGFLTHCGWNSMLEGITAGIPMLTFPGYFDQFLNERLLVDVLKLGVPSGRKKPFWHEIIAGGEAEVTREAVKRTVKELMGQSLEAQERRRRAREMGKTARRAMEVGGSSEQALTQFIRDFSPLAEMHCQHATAKY